MPWLQTLTGAALVGLAAAAYDEYILAPSSRTLYPASIWQVNGTVQGSESLVGESAGNARFEGASTVTLDFGKNIAGLVTLQIGDVDEDQYIGLAYSESSLWVTSVGSDGTADAGLDEVLWFQPNDAGNYTVDRDHERGAFRYLTLVHNTTGNLEVVKATVYYTPLPHIADDAMRDYTGYFHCDDELINRIWYAGAYTNQICTIDPHHGDALTLIRKVNSSQLGDETPPNPWYYNYTITNGTSALVDGAKRDRLVWAGDMAIAVPGMIVSYSDLVSVANSLDSLFAVQNTTTGQLPYAGRPFPETLSFTYHLYTLIGVADYYLYSNELSYLQGKWDQWKLAMNFSLSFIDSSGLANVTSPNDWLRFGMGGHNIEANAILYHTLNQGIMLGEAIGEEQSLLDTWTETAAKIKTSANTLLWNETAGLYHDNETTTLMPQDGNSWAVLSNLTDSSEKASRISSGLSARWGPYGAPAVEAADAVSPFISGFELQAHLLAGNVSAALALVRLEWGFMMDDPRMTNSTFIEGYSSDGRLHYAPYTNDPRISHAHGWATGPTSSLTFYIGGIHLLSAGGATWEMSPRLGDLKSVDAGFSTSLGTFSSTVNASSSGSITGFRFSAPAGSSGSVSLPGVQGALHNENGTSITLVNGEASGVSGGNWTLAVMGSGNATGAGTAPEPYTGKAATYGASAVLAGIAALFSLVL
ncbi:hypothetical protein AC578_4246 [Pseudocercospora eumusae]|uniref:Alpha-L-rhamnosidase six-hairpin glycosidase domain-containing protein n=1 Tax=Pseudocercospora eumusae TaxID=321146 RepID=A0A139HAQ1_9PEZI|nr:hypothetical protein AC578_4246 [Pseudocercospora eumusae]